MLLIFMSLSWMFSILFMFLKHPLSLGFILLLQTIIISVSSGILTLNYWFSYILFLIMIGGMLVLFIYMTSVASNEKFKFSNKLMMYQMITMFIISFFVFSDNFFTMSDMANSDTTSQFNTDSMTNLTISKFFNFPNMFIMILIIFYLLITMIAVVKITQSKMGPFRQTSS